MEKTSDLVTEKNLRVIWDEINRLSIQVSTLKETFSMIMNGGKPNVDIEKDYRDFMVRPPGLGKSALKKRRQ